MLPIRALFSGVTRSFLPRWALLCHRSDGLPLHRRFGHAAGLLDDLLTLGSADREWARPALWVETLTRELTEAGYRILDKEGIFLKPFTTSQLQALNLNEQIIEAMCSVGIHYPELSCALLLEAVAQVA